MTTLEEVKRGFATLLDTARHRGVRKMLTGRRTGPAVHDVTLAGAETNRVWVRQADDSRESTQAWGYANAVNIWVWVELDPFGELRIIGPVYQQSTETAGPALGAVTSPPLVGEAAPVFVSGRQFLPGLVHLDASGGLTLRVEPFHYDDNYFAGGTIAMTPPTTVGKQAWCAVVLNPSTNTLIQVTGTLYDDFLVMDETSIPTDIVVPAEHIPLAAVVLTNGQTDITGADKFADFRYHFDRRRVSGHVIEDEGTPLTQRTTLNFVGAGVTVTDSGGKTVVTIPGGSGDLTLEVVKWRIFC
jgi:hypothetical protein